MSGGYKRVLLILLIFLGPGFIIWYMAKTFTNHFLELPYLGYTYTLDERGNKIDSSAYQLQNVELTTFDGVTINDDSLKNKILIFTTIQNSCPNIDSCGLGIYHFNEILYDKMIGHPEGYSNVRVISVLTDIHGNPDSIPSTLLKEELSKYNQRNWWLVTGSPKPFIDFPYYGDLFSNQPADNLKAKEVGSKAFVNALVLFDDKGFVRGVTGARTDSDIRNFFDLLKLLKKEEFKANLANQKK